jgi:DNA-binding HxlR family transcriptional regulator
MEVCAMKAHHGCPIQATSNAISGKWKVRILWHLSFQAYRFSELRELLHGVSEKVLTAQLRELESDGLVLRRSAHTVPPRVEYRLSPAGEDLIPIMERMCEWAGVHLGVLPNLRPRQGERAASDLTATEPAPVS